MFAEVTLTFDDAGQQSTSRLLAPVGYMNFPNNSLQSLEYLQPVLGPHAFLSSSRFSSAYTIIYSDSVGKKLAEVQIQQPISFGFHTGMGVYGEITNESDFDTDEIAYSVQLLDYTENFKMTLQAVTYFHYGS